MAAKWCKHSLKTQSVAVLHPVFGPPTGAWTDYKTLFMLTTTNKVLNVAT